MDFAEQIRQAIATIRTETAGLVRRIAALELKLAAYESAFESVAKLATALPDLLPRFWVTVRAPYFKPQSILAAVKAMRAVNPAIGLREAKETCDYGGRFGPLSRNGANELYEALKSLGYSVSIEDK